MVPAPFQIQVAEEVLMDLRQRLARTRWPDSLPDAGWDYGTNLAYLRHLVDYWQESYDWRAQALVEDIRAFFRPLRHSKDSL
jgi:hypothetical protein